MMPRKRARRAWGGRRSSSLRASASSFSSSGRPAASASGQGSRQKILHVRLGSGEQLFPPLFGQVQTGGIGLLAVLAGLDGFGQRPGVHLAHEAAYELQLTALAFTVADAGIQAQGLQQIGRQGQSVQFVDGQLGQLGAQILQGRTLTLLAERLSCSGASCPLVSTSH